MKVAVIGSRSFTDYKLLVSVLSQLTKVTEIISGGAKGADSLAEKYAKGNKIKLNILYPEWQKYGKAAGIIRNREIITTSDLCIAFWDGESKGTKHAISLAKKLGKSIDVYKINSIQGVIDVK